MVRLERLPDPAPRTAPASRPGWGGRQHTKRGRREAPGPSRDARQQPAPVTGCALPDSHGVGERHSSNY